MTIMATAFIIFASCNKEKENVNKETDQLKKELILLNQSITLTPIDDSKGFWQAVGDALQVAGADIVGAGAGLAAGAKVAVVAGLATGGTGAIAVEVTCGVVAGAGASVAAGRAVASKGNIDNAANYPFEIDIHSYGYLHNQIVEQTYSKNSFPLKDVLEQANIKNAEEVIKLYQSEPYQNFMQKLLTNTEEYRNDLEMTKFIQKCDDIPEKSAIVFDYFFQKFLQIKVEDDILMVAQAYEKFITCTNLLSQEEKEIIMLSLSIAKYSPFYWLSVIQ